MLATCIGDVGNQIQVPLQEQLMLFTAVYSLVKMCGWWGVSMYVCACECACVSGECLFGFCLFKEGLLLAWYSLLGQAGQQTQESVCLFFTNAN